MRKLIVLLSFVGAAFLSVESILAQGTGTIHGNVTDPSGLAVPHAKVKATLVARGLVRNTETDERGRPITDNNFLVLFNAHHEEIPFTLPQLAGGPRWLVVLDTAYEEGLAWDGMYKAGSAYPLQGRSLALLQQQRVSP